MRILGIDPGLARAGWGVIDYKGGKAEVLAYDCIETNAKTETGQRLLQVHHQMEKLLTKYQPDAVAIEQLFFGANTTTAFAVGQARGVIVLAAAAREIPTFSYTPLQVKMAITGYGRAEKTQVGKMIKVILKLKAVPKPDDVADALAIGLTHAFTFRPKPSSKNK